jgi:hypothetical protein
MSLIPFKGMQVKAKSRVRAPPGPFLFEIEFQPQKKESFSFSSFIFDNIPFNYSSCIRRQFSSS